MGGETAGLAPLLTSLLPSRSKRRAIGLLALAATASYGLSQYAQQQRRLRARQAPAAADLRCVGSASAERHLPVPSLLLPWLPLLLPRLGRPLHQPSLYASHIAPAGAVVMPKMDAAGAAAAAAVARR